MPQSDTWPGGTGLERMTGTDSAGSCDSVSDDSMEHLSAEEKACLMFLEETIESLDTEDDEPDQLPGPGNVATKVADLSASMSVSRLSGSPKPGPTEVRSSKVIQSYLVPTPLVVAGSPPGSGLGTSPNKNLFCKTQASDGPGVKKNQKPAAASAPSEVNVVKPPPTKSKDHLFRTAEGPLPRGPLSYDALVHLRRSASTKKTPLCPTVDHTINVNHNLPEGQNLKLPKPKDSKPKAAPPAVAPKPKIIPANVTVKTQNDASTNSDLSHSVKQAPDPQAVRLEALQKLGLVRDQEPEDESAAQSNPSVKRPNGNSLRSSSFCDAQLAKEPRSRCLQSSTSFKHDRLPRSRPAEAAGLERPAPLCRNHPEPHDATSAEQLQPTTATQPNSVSYTVMVVPGMGADRKEALRKLGLLKK